MSHIKDQKEWVLENLQLLLSYLIPSELKQVMIIILCYFFIIIFLFFFLFNSIQIINNNNVKSLKLYPATKTTSAQWLQTVVTACSTAENSR